MQRRFEEAASYLLQPPFRFAGRLLRISEGFSREGLAALSFLHVGIARQSAIYAREC